MRLVCFLAVVFGLAALSPAPIDSTKDFKKPVPEVSQETLAAVQSGPITPGGPAPDIHPDAAPQVQSAMSSSQAEVALARADRQKAEEALRRASSTIEDEAPNPLRFILIGSIMVALGAGIVALLRYFADRHVPAPKAKSEP